MLPGLIDRPSFQDVIRTRTIEGLGRSGDERALPVVRDAWRPAAPWYSRRAVVAALAELAYGTGMARAARDLIEPRLRDRDFRVRGEAAAGLARLGAPEALAAIRGALAGELDGRTRRRMNDAIRDIETGTRPADEVRQLHDEVSRLRGENEKLRERLDWVEARLGEVPPPPATGGPRPKRPRPVSRRPRSTRPVRR